MRIIISYDITSDKRRRKIAKILEGYGYRVQYSVFECDITKKQLTELKTRLRPLVNTKSNESIRIYPLHSDTVNKIHILGKDHYKTLDPTVVV